VVSNTNDSGAGSLRQAILDSNATNSLDTITFQISGSGVHTITPLTPLPPLTDPVVLDGTTQPGYAGQPLVELNGASAGNNAGLRVLAGGSTISGLVINRFGGSGIQVEGPGTNSILGNYIGTDPTGTINRGNGLEGVWLYNSSGNVVGAAFLGQGNLISGNADAGVYVLNGSNNTITGNLIGTTATGDAPLGNANNGVTLYNAANNSVGGGSPASRNVISGNRSSGVYLYGAGATGNFVLQNYIGTSQSGSAAISNAGDGITLQGAIANTIGRSSPPAGNLISGNGYNGVSLTGSSSNSLLGNLIGTDVAGASALGNRLAGVLLVASSNNIVGQPPSRVDLARPNVISANGDYGLFLTSPQAQGNLVQGNFIGTSANGSGALGNGSAGVGISGAPNNTIGGSGPGAGNLISANHDAGIYVVQAGAGGNQFLGNIIGAGANGTTALGNVVEGIYIESAPGNIIGGSVAGAGNLISANGTRGIFLTNAPGTVIQGNLVGTTTNGASPLGNTFHNIELEAGTANTIIGGPGAAANRIAYAQTVYCGVRIRNGSFNNLIDGNSIFSNGALGIDLGTAGVTPNDPCDTDTGANLLQNFPVLSLAVTGNATGVRGTLNSAAATAFRLQFFASSACDASGSGEGQLYLGEMSVATDSSCNAAFVARLPVAVPPGYVVTATATDPANNTSEFSACVPVAPVPRLNLSFAGGQAALSWTNTAAGFALKQTASLSPPVQWTTVTNAVTSSGGQFAVSLTLPPGSRFYALSFE
jgi:parallel beta-helix repeat protein